MEEEGGGDAGQRSDVGGWSWGCDAGCGGGVGGVELEFMIVSVCLMTIIRGWLFLRFVFLDRGTSELGNEMCGF